MKGIKIIIFLLTLSLLSSCIDELPEEGNLNYCPGVRLDDGTCPQSTSSGGRSTVSSGWDFSNSSDYSFNSNFVEISSGRATLKEIDTNFSGSDFSSGSHVGTHSDNSKIEMIDKNHDSLDVRNILQDKAADILVYLRFDGDLDNLAQNGTDASIDGTLPYSTESKVGSSSISVDRVVSNILNVNNTDVGTSAFTAAAWINPSIYSDWGRLFLSLIHI